MSKNITSYKLDLKESERLVKELRADPEITSLILSDCEAGAIQYLAKELARIPTVTDIELYDYFNEKDERAILNLLPYNHLKSLKISKRCDSMVKVDELTAALVVNHSLQKLTIVCRHFSSVDMQAFTNYLQDTKSLQELQLSSFLCDDTDDVKRLADAIIQNTSLTTLDIHHLRISDDWRSEMSRMMSRSLLRAIKLNPWLTDVHLNFYAKLNAEFYDEVNGYVARNIAIANARGTERRDMLREVLRLRANENVVTDLQDPKWHEVSVAASLDALEKPPRGELLRNSIEASPSLQTGRERCKGVQRFGLLAEDGKEQDKKADCVSAGLQI